MENEVHDCSNCLFSKFDKDEQMGHCIRYRPTPININEPAEFPIVAKTTFCHEWECC